MDIFSHLEKVVATTDIRSEEWDRLTEGLADLTQLNVEDVRQWVAFTFNHAATKEELLDYAIESECIDLERMQFDVDDIHHYCYTKYFNHLFSGMEIQDYYDTPAAMKKDMTRIFKEMYDEYAVLFDTDAYIIRKHAPSNVITFNKRGCDDI